jgi:predicted dehydrogenase
MKTMHRRVFLRRTAGSTAILASWGLSLSTSRSANDEVRVAVVGFRGHGRTHINNYLKMKGVRLVALCDADRAVLDQGVRDLAAKGVKVDACQDVRRLLERKDIDAISTATPNHWHALVTVWACQAGKDVCVEKPVCHSIWEGRQMVRAARKYQRVVQGDLDLRSHRANDEARVFLKSGALGKVQVARGFCHKRRLSIGLVPGHGHVPDTLDYDLWCGPAAKLPIDRKELHYDWHWVWNTGCGELGNNGPHQLDLIRWMLCETGLPRRVMSLGGRFGYQDAGETPNSQLVLYDYASAPVVFEVRGLPTEPGGRVMDTYEAVTTRGVKLRNHFKGQDANCNVIFQCEGGWIDFTSDSAYDNQGTLIRKFENTGSVDPQSNFIQAVRSRKTADLKTDIEEGHLSTALCHLGNISHRLGTAAEPAAMLEALMGDNDALEAFERFRRHLGVHGVDLGQTRGVLGPWLTLSPGEEAFTGPRAREANALLRRECRAPFVMPEQV